MNKIQNKVTNKLQKKQIKITMQNYERNGVGNWGESKHSDQDDEEEC